MMEENRGKKRKARMREKQKKKKEGGLAVDAGYTK